MVSWNRVRGTIPCFLIGVGMFFAFNHEAVASSGCSAVNSGAWNFSAPPGINGTLASGSTLSFGIGDRVTLFFRPAPDGSGAFALNQSARNFFFPQNIPASGAYTVTLGAAQKTLRLDLTGPATGVISITAACLSTDSQNIRSAQTALTKAVAELSGQAITGAIDSGISDAFNPNAGLINGGQGRLFLSFADRFAGSSTRAEDALAAVYRSVPTKAAPASTRSDWNLWLDVRGTGWNRSNTGGDLNGDQVNVTSGLGRKVSPDLLVGVIVGYENFRTNVASLSGTLKGDGETLGAYIARRSGNLRYDAAVAWSHIDYNASSGAATGAFSGSRWIASSGVTGNYTVGAGGPIWEPSARVYVAWEREPGWSDSLGASHDDFNFSTGRASFGGKLSYPWRFAHGTVTPYMGFYGDFHFSHDNANQIQDALTEPTVTGIGPGWGGRAVSGMAYSNSHGDSISLGGDYGGIGATYKVWSAKMNARLAF
jgi:hypothetical protein